jgi:putative transposase
LIEQLRGQFEIRIMCRALSVSVGGFSAWMKRPLSARQREAWMKRPLSARQREDGEITKEMVSISHQQKGRYGSPRIHNQLRDEGIRVGRKRVVRLMKQEHLAAHHRTHRVVTTHADPAAIPAENVLNRAFEAQAPNTRMGR